MKVGRKIVSDTYVVLTYKNQIIYVPTTSHWTYWIFSAINCKWIDFLKFYLFAKIEINQNRYFADLRIDTYVSCLQKE